MQSSLNEWILPEYTFYGRNYLVGEETVSTLCHTHNQRMLKQALTRADDVISTEATGYSHPQPSGCVCEREDWISPALVRH